MVLFAIVPFQSRLFAPVAKSVMLSPGQGKRSGPADMAGTGLMVSKTESEAKQPFGLVA